TRRAKRDTELRALRLLQRHYAGLTGFTLSELAPPEPDFLAALDDRRIGIELTDIYGNPRLRQYESESEGILDSARRLLDADGQFAVVVCIYWRGNPPLSKSTRSLAAE